MPHPNGNLKFKDNYRLSLNVVRCHIPIVIKVKVTTVNVYTPVQT